MYLLYRIFTAAGMLVIAPYFAWRAWRRGEAPGAFAERMGRVPVLAAERAGARSGESQSAIWIHAVSVGEVLASVPLAKALKCKDPSRPVLVSTTTETGQRLARERLAAADGIFYFPLDWVVPVRRALNSIRPDAVIVMETEIWPNFLREAQRRGVPVIFANARISKRSFARFQRWKFLLREFFERTLNDAAFFLAQTEEDAKRLKSMGAPEERVEVTGNLKYDVDAPQVAAFGGWLAAEVKRQERWPVVVAGSVVEEEEQRVLAAFDIVQRRWRHALLVLAPRKPGRFRAAMEIAESSGWRVVQRSRIDMTHAFDEDADVVLLDSIGELAGLYSLADAVFVGGSLVNSGGHNILEPAWFGRPPVFGTSMDNFRAMADEFLDAHAAIQVNNEAQLGKVWVQLIEDPTASERMGKAARQLAQRNRGATARSLERIFEVLDARGQQS
jgi:3-deoxy-D-manno-octulosonic-acid transferase